MGVFRVTLIALFAALPGCVLAFCVRAAWHVRRFGHWHHFVRSGLPARTRWIYRSTSLVASDCLWPRGYLLRHPLLDGGQTDLDGRRVELQFNLRVPATFKIPDERTVTASESLFMVTINPSITL